MAETHTIARLVVAEGAVQGVGYREFTRRAALRLGVSGWVRNWSDGAVEALLRGSPVDVEALIAEMRKGPRSAVVDSVRVIERDEIHGDGAAASGRRLEPPGASVRRRLPAPRRLAGRRALHPGPRWRAGKDRRRIGGRIAGGKGRVEPLVELLLRRRFARQGLARLFHLGDSADNLRKGFRCADPCAPRPI